MAAFRSRGSSSSLEARELFPPISKGHDWLRLVVRCVLSLLTAGAGVLVADALMASFDAGPHALWTALLLVVVSSILSPLAVRLVLPVLVYTAGLATLALNAGVVLAADRFLTGVEVAGVGAAVVVSLVVTLCGMVASWLFSLNDDATFTRAVIRRRIRQREGTPPETDVPGIVFFEIDGCSHGVIQRALRAGHMPNLDRWLRSSTHALHHWETDLSSQTGASQAGLLMGDNRGIVAFRWFERDRQRVMVSGKPRDATLIEQRLSTGAGLLASDGASRNNLLSGDAPSRQMTLSSVLEKGGAGSAWASYFSSADNVARTLFRVIADMALELGASMAMRRRRVWPRLHKSFHYALMRAATTVVMPDITVDSIVADMVAGRPKVYATFVGYDEVAHHDGVERPSARRQLQVLDRYIRRIEQARRYAPRPYEIVVLSDHGQSQGATFAQRYGESLEGLVQRVVGDGHTVLAHMTDEDSEAQVNGAVRELGAGHGSVRRLLDRGDPPGTNAAELGGDTLHAERGTVLVMASGNLGLIYLTGRPGRADEEELERSCPGLLEALVQHPGIGLVVVRTARSGSVAIGSEGRCWLASGLVDGTDPLAAYGPNALRHLRRHDTFAHMPDLLLISRWWQDVDEVAAFEELIGSHGGLGGEQSHAFVLAPTWMPWPEEPVVGAGDVHRVLQRWIALAQDPLRHPAAPPATSSRPVFTRVQIDQAEGVHIDEESSL